MLWMDSGNVRWVFHWLGAEFTKTGTDFANSGENQGVRNHHEIAHKDGEPEYQPLMNRSCQWFIEQYAYYGDSLEGPESAPHRLYPDAITAMTTH